jgi:hypothetical protein
VGEACWARKKIPSAGRKRMKVSAALRAFLGEFRVRIASVVRVVKRVR